MKFSDSRSTQASVEDVLWARCQPGAREQACKESGALSWTVDVTPAAGGFRIQVDRVMPPSVPDFVRKFVGEQIHVRQVEVWGPQADDASRQADVKVDIVGQPASMLGTLRIEPSGSGSVETVTGEVKVAVPFFGSKIEPEIAKVVQRALAIEQQVGDSWIQQRNA